MTDPVFTLSRTFAAPRDALWAAWTQPDKIAAWFGPKGSTARIIRQDFRVGGECLQHVQTPWGMEIYGLHRYTLIAPQDRLEWLNSFSDSEGNPVAHPMNPTWPKVMDTTVTFEDDGSGTKVTVRWVPHQQSSDIEIKTFADGMDSMTQGWGGSFDVLAEWLESP